MRTKTLLIAAAALAATVTASQAQTVYSANVVGYINSTISNRVFTLVGNQLDTGSNTLDNVLSSGLVSSATELLFWNGAGYNQYYYYNNGDSPNGNAGWFTSGGSPVTSTNLPVGGGVFIYNSSGGTVTVPTVGQVTQGTNMYTVPAGFSVWSVPQPLAGLPLDNTNINFPAVSSADSYLQWNGNGFNQLYYYNNGDSPNGVAGWFTAGGVAEDTNAAYWPTAGQAFFIHHVGAPETWTNVFQVQ